MLGRGGYYFLNITTKAIIKRAHGAYTPITRMDESIYNAYNGKSGLIYTKFNKITLISFLE